MTDPRQNFRGLLRRGELEEALRGMVAFVDGLEGDVGLRGKPFPFPWIDEICEKIGDASAFELLASRRPTVHQDHDVVLLTEGLVQGGHVEILRDLSDMGERQVVIVVTNVYNHKAPLLRGLAEHPRVIDVVELDDPAMLTRLRSAQAIIANPAARRVLVLCHGSDAISVAAAAPVTEKPVLFFHHCDHTPGLGCFMRHAVHVDLHNLAHEHCRFHLGIDAGYVCMTSRGGGVSRADGGYADPMFKTATCGNEHKMTKLRYPILYSEVVTRLIRARGGVHFHVGILSDDFISAVKDSLQEAGLPRESFIHVGHVSGFREIVEALEIDLYVPTLPQAGGKAMVDAMAAGVPILVHENAIDRLWGGRDLAYPTAPSWSSLEELDERLDWFGDASHWQEQAIASRRYFDEYHANSLFAMMLRANGRLSGKGPPPLKPYRPGFVERLRAQAASIDQGEHP